MGLQPNQRRAMFAKLRNVQAQQAILLRNTSLQDVKVGAPGFRNKESKLLKLSDKISNKIIGKGTIEDAAVASNINVNTQKMFVRKAEQSGISQERIKAVRIRILFFIRKILVSVLLFLPFFSSISSEQ